MVFLSLYSLNYKVLKVLAQYLTFGSCRFFFSGLNVSLDESEIVVHKCMYFFSLPKQFNGCGLQLQHLWFYFQVKVFPCNCFLWVL